MNTEEKSAEVLEEEFPAWRYPQLSLRLRAMANEIVRLREQLECKQSSAPSK